MKFTRKEKRIYFFIFSLACFLVVFTLYQNFNPASQNSLRNLIDDDEMEKRCQKAKSEFEKKYTDDPKKYQIEKNNEEEKLTQYEDILKKIIEKEEYGKIRKYLPRIVVYIIIAALDIIFIIFWFLFCCYACRNVEKQNRIGCGAKCCFIIFFILCIGVILLSVIGIIYTPYLKRGLNTIACSVYKLVFHFLYGINGENEELKWTGLYNISENLTGFVGYKEERDTIDKLISTFEIINNNTLNNIEKAMEDLDCMYPYNSFLLFGGVAIFNLLGLLSMFLIFVCECKCMSCLFHTFWNLEIIFIIITLAISALLGIFSAVTNDISKILLKEKDPMFLNNTFNFNFNCSEILEQINICLNGKGDLYNNLFTYKDFHNDLEEKKNKIINETELKNEYNCSFFEMDYKILADELRDSIAKKLYFISLLFIIVDVAGIVSIFFGITIYNSQKSYYPPNEINVNINNRIPNPNNRVDLSSENLKGQNNEVIFSKKIK